MTLMLMLMPKLMPMPLGGVASICGLVKPPGGGSDKRMIDHLAAAKSRSHN